MIPGDSVTILSPHLDDAVLSLGAAIARATRSGAAVEVVTVFAGDPDASEPSGAWDARSGFRTCGEAIRTRRSEDLRACRLLGASTRWLPFADLQYEPPLRSEVARALTPILAAASTILTPGFPMTNPDHRVVTELALDLAPAAARLGVYLEQPYDWWSVAQRLSRPRLPASLRFRRPPPAPDESALGTPLEWAPLAASASDIGRKYRAAHVYASQVGNLGHLAVSRILLRERRRGGEYVAWIR